MGQMNHAQNVNLKIEFLYGGIFLYDFVLLLKLPQKSQAGFAEVGTSEQLKLSWKIYHHISLHCLAASATRECIKYSTVLECQNVILKQLKNNTQESFIQEALNFMNFSHVIRYRFLVIHSSLKYSQSH